VIAAAQDLAQKGWSPVQSEQQYISQLQQQEAALKNAQAALALAERQIDSLKAQRASAEAQLGESKAQLDQARVNLERTEIRSPVNGWVTNLLAQLGDYANVGQNQITLVDADSFWIDAYFTETSLGSIQEGDPANVKLMGYSEIVRGHVGSIARGINVVNAQAGPQGLATVNPIFTWVAWRSAFPCASISITCPTA
jgi:multidrug resistance efflux pump